MLAQIVCSGWHPYDEVCHAFASSDGRKFYSKPGELFIASFEGQVAGVGTDDFASETQAQTGSIHLTASGGIGAVKSFKYAVPVGWRNL